MSTKDLAELERRKYEKIFHHKNYGANSMGAKYVTHITTRQAEVPEGRAHSIGDFGCARGATFPALMKAGFIVYPVDHVNVLDKQWKGLRNVAPMWLGNLWESPLPKVDYGICTDVMEHIPEEVVAATIMNIRESVKYGVLWTVAHGPDMWGRVIGEVLHVTQKSKPWWKMEFAKVWDTVEVLSTEAKHTVLWTE